MADDIPLTGPAALEHALSKIDLDAAEKEHRDMVATGPKTRRPKAVHALNAIEGLRRNDLKPTQLMVQNVPVIPPSFRPFSVAGDTFVPGDANELYRDLFNYKDVYDEAAGIFGEEGSSDARMALYDTVKALYGYSDPVAQKSKQRGVSGFLRQVTGSSPKFGFYQRRMLSKPQDSVARGTISIDPDLSLDEVGVPLNMAWTMYGPYIQRRLVRSGMSPKSALQEVADRSPAARKALDTEAAARPVIYTRAPSWHRFNVIAGRPKLIEGDTIAINPFVTAGMNADFDGDQMNLHVPSMDGSVEEAKEKLMPSKMLWQIRDPERVMPELKHEQVLGLFTAQKRKGKKKHRFATEAEALEAIGRGQVDLADEVEVAA